MRAKFKFAAAAALLCITPFATRVAQAAPLLSEDFSYADGPISTVSGGNWTIHSGTDSGTTALNVSSGQAVINQGDTHGSGADANRNLSSTVDPLTDNTTKIYSSFSCKIEDYFVAIECIFNINKLHF